MRYLVLLLAVSLCGLASAGLTEFGAHAGIFVPTGDLADGYNMSLMLGANFLAHMTSFAVEGSASYVFLSPEESLGDDVSAYMIPILVGIRSYTGNLFAGGGLALHVVGVEVGDVSDSDSEVGAYGNVGTSLPAGSFEIELSAKLHWIDFDEMGITLTGGVYF
ncbi:hypothetical protein JW921_10900 [Candidatus Fermentibacterales bacterium]|nr:hypothetical protein [Candidatus Fermentibacterales bacterium]